MYFSSGNMRFELFPIEGTGIDDLCMEALVNYFIYYRNIDLESMDDLVIKRVLLNTDILIDSNSKTVCSMGGMLLFGKEVNKHLPQACIDFAHFDGMNITGEIINRKIIKGRMADIIDKTLELIYLNTRTMYKINGAKRDDIEDYPKKVLREAIVNAVIHRDYSISGEDIKIFMFDNRIEFRSPGNLMDNQTIDKVKIGKSSLRNPNIMEVLQHMGYSEKLGRGVPMIFEALKKHEAKEPIIDVSGGEFILTIFKR